MFGTGPEITIGELDGWTYEIKTTFVQVSDEKRDAYWAFLKRFAEEIKKHLEKEATDDPQKGSE